MQSAASREYATLVKQTFLLTSTSISTISGDWTGHLCISGCLVEKKISQRRSVCKYTLQAGSYTHHIFPQMPEYVRAVFRFT